MGQVTEREPNPSCPHLKARISVMTATVWPETELAIRQSTHDSSDAIVNVGSVTELLQRPECHERSYSV